MQYPKPPKLNQQRQHHAGPEPQQATLAQDPPPAQPALPGDPPTSRLCIKNIPKYLPEQRLKDHFSTKGQVTDVKILKAR
jgi:multiple RNA-binding domain-containing protein 1